MIARLAARRFRNLDSFEIGIEPGTTLLQGATGAGKTSVLEAIYLVATTKSFRTSQLADCQRVAEEAVGESATSEAAKSETAESETVISPDGFSVEAEVDSDRRTRLELGWSSSQGLWREVNGESAPAGRYLEALSAVAWSSVENETLVGPPALRRRLLDRGVVGVQPAAVEVLGRYRRALGHKRALLTDRRGARGTLDAWNQILATTGIEIGRRRRRFVAALGKALVEVQARSGLGWPNLALDFRPSLGEGTLDEAAALDRLDAEKARERESGRPLIGPHRDRFEVLWRGQGIRGIASAGERKALGLLLLAAQAEVLREVGREPVLLLDDVDAELDRATLRAVARAFEGVDQRIISSNRPEIFDQVATDHRWQIEHGQIRPL